MFFIHLLLKYSTHRVLEILTNNFYIIEIQIDKLQYTFVAQLLKQELWQ